MIFVDINTFYSERGGGIRTYHQQKCLWFQSHPEHQYYVFYPGSRHTVQHLAPNVTLISFRGLAVTPHPDGYRLFYDFIRMGRWVRQVNPDVIEVGEPWLAGPFGLLCKALRLYRKPLCAFYHSDPIVTYLLPRVRRIRWPVASRPALWMAGLCSRIFYWVQNRYDWTVVSSKVMERRLRDHGVCRLARMHFGFDEGFERKTGSGGLLSPGAVKFLYVGRLERDKGVDLLEHLLPDLLDVDFPEGTLRVVGAGPRESWFREWQHPRYHWRGFIDDRDELAEVYISHHVLLAPGPFETFGLTVLEALAAGLIVVGPDTGGVGEILKGGNSPFIFRAGDAQDFRRAIREAVAAAENDYQTEAKRSRDIAHSYGTWREAVGCMVEFYQTKVGR